MGHKGRKLPQSFYNVFGPRWKPVMTNDEMAAQEDEEKHPSILKNQDLNETAMTEDGVNVNSDLTTVTWTSDEKEELKKAEEKKDDEETEKEVKEEAKEEVKEEVKDEAKEETEPLN